MSQTITAPVSKVAVATAQLRLDHARRKMTAWLKFRQMNDEVLAGVRATKVPLERARQLIAQQRDPRIEQRLADHLYALLAEVMPDAQLPQPSPATVVELAQAVITGQLPSLSPGPQGSAHPWMWPAIIVGGLLLAATTAIGAWADVAKTREEYACIQAGACTDYGFWLKAGGVIALGWFVWTQTGVKDTIRGFGKKGGR